MQTPVITNVGARVDLTIRCGSDFSTTLTLTNSDGSPLDLTGAAIAAQLRKRPLDDLTAAFVVSVADPPTLGNVTLSLTAAETAAIPCGNSVLDNESRYSWDMTLTVGLIVSSPLQGLARVAAGVTR